MAKAKTYPIDVYAARLHVATTRKQLDTLRRRYELAPAESIGASYLAVETAANNTPHLVIWIDTASLDGPDLAEMVAHEAVHSAAQLLDHIGQEATQHDSEALAYLAGYIAGRTWDALS